VGTIVDALNEVGAARSIVIDEHGVILAGNATVEAAGEAGLRKVHVVDADGDTIVAVRRTGLTAKQKARLALFDNRAAELADGWDLDVLKQLQADGVNLDGLWHEDELAELMGLEPKAGLTDPDSVPELRPTDIVRGDLFALGQHRLLCGDSTNAEDVARVMGGEKAQCVFTDPPYGVDYQAMRKGTKRIANDATPEAASEAIRSALALAFYASAHFVCSGWKYLGMVIDAMEACSIEPKACIVWDKKRGVQNLDRYHKQHEFIVYAGPYGGQKTVAGDVWQVDRDFDPDHATPKPVELVSIALTTATLSEWRIYDPFLGSGTTLIACEQLNRRCFAIEIEPAYVQVALDRWEAFTGQKAVKVG
jgi:DNA modification methylase